MHNNLFISLSEEMRLKQLQHWVFPSHLFHLQGLLNMLTYLIIFANMYKAWKVKFVQLCGKGNVLKGNYTWEKKKKAKHRCWVAGQPALGCIFCLTGKHSSGFGLVHFLQRVLSQLTREQVRVGVTPVGRILHQRHKLSRKNVWWILFLIEKLVSLLVVPKSCFQA